MKKGVFGVFALVLLLFSFVSAEQYSGETEVAFFSLGEVQEISEVEGLPIFWKNTISVVSLILLAVAFVMVYKLKKKRKAKKVVKKVSSVKKKKKVAKKKKK